MQITSELSPDSAAHGPLVVVMVEGEIDYTNSDELAGAIRNVLARYDPAAIRVDLSVATFIDSTGLGALIAAYRASADARCSFTVTSPTPAFLRILTITGLSDLFGVVAPAVSEQAGPQRIRKR
jgi:anti-sigma B factor antagonist